MLDLYFTQLRWSFTVEETVVIGVGVEESQSAFSILITWYK